MYAFTHDELPIAIHIDRFPGLALHRPWSVGKSRHGDFCRRRQFQAEIAWLADVGGKVAAGLVHCARQRFIGEVDYELPRALDVDKRVLAAAVGPQIHGKHAERWILAEHVKETER